MAQSRIIDYNSDMDHVIWWYEDHETKEYVEVYDSILAFMKKLIRHIPLHRRLCSEEKKVNKND